MGTDQVKREGPGNRACPQAVGAEGSEDADWWAGRSCHEAHHRPDAEGRDPGAAKVSLHVLQQREWMG